MHKINWNDAWGLYDGATKEIQKEILKNFNLRKHLLSCSPDIQVEILRKAPKEIVAMHKKLLHDTAKKKLGLMPKPEKINWNKLI